MPLDRKIKRRGFGPFAFFVLGGVFSAPCLAEPVSEGVFARFDSVWVSEHEPINTSIERWGADFSAGERQWNLTELELGFRSRGGLEVSVLQRALVDLRINDEAAAFYGRIERKEDLSAGREIPVHLKINGFSAQGLRLGFAQSLDRYNLELGAGLSLLYARHLMAGNLDGRFRAFSESEYDFDADVDYVYYRDLIFDRTGVDRPSGLGWSADVWGSWSPSENLRFDFDFKDLAARIRWKDVPYARAQASTDRKRYDDQGYVVFDPLLTGVEGYLGHYTQSLDPRLMLGGEWFFGQAWGVAAEAHHQFDYTRLGLGGAFRVGTAARFKMLYWPEQQAVSLKGNWRDWSASLMLDQVEWQKVQTLGITLSYAWR